MSDTHIFVKYKDTPTSRKVKQTDICCQRGVFKSFLCDYDKDNEFGKHYTYFPSLVWNVHRAKQGLEDVINFWNSDKSGYQWEYEEIGKPWLETLKDKEIVEVIFECY